MSLNRKKQKKFSENKEKQFRILVVSFLTLLIMMSVLVIFQERRFQNYKTANTELLVTGIELLSTCLELSEISMEEVQSVWLDEKFEGLKQELRENE